MEENWHFKIDWANHIVGRKFTILDLFHFVFEGNFPSTSPQEGYIWRGDLIEGFLRYQFGGLIHGGAYFRNFTVCPNSKIFTVSSSFYVSFQSWVKMNSTNWPAPNVWIFIAQLVEHCSLNTEAMGLNPLKVEIFFQVNLQLLKFQ